MGLILVLVAAPLVQVMLINRLPWGGPDLVALAVVWMALARGPMWGSVAGLLAGLAADVTPPADHTIGRTALVLAFTGFMAGRWQEGRLVLVAPLSTALATLGQAAATVALGDESWLTVVPELPRSVGWTVAAGSLLTAVVIGLRRRRQERKGREQGESRPVALRQVRRV
ncbi:rod shape-determining protein MreD [Nonomuraea sp. NN258]|uniref:rod shape-determining protein MreD n=1 Tax=Nonomuraea antri TaxID=2730852 RepID=UPI0015699520|nr:rod shape-determining protein MreD [Nonomuraea antri]NRQ36242.1 rod shape-determining protein MreD [Nonomuraea antri]